MKKVYIVRHAKSSWKFPDLTDIERPLNKRGRRDVPVMGSHLLAENVHPDRLLSSPANRAYTTAKGIGEKLNISEEEIHIIDELYHSGSNTILEIMKLLDDSVNQVMLFGHNPGFTDFANQLADTNIFNIPTCGVVVVRVDLNTWKNVIFGSGTIEKFYFPKGI